MGLVLSDVVRHSLLPKEIIVRKHHKNRLRDVSSMPPRSLRWLQAHTHHTSRCLAKSWYCYILFWRTPNERREEHLSPLWSSTALRFVGELSKKRRCSFGLGPLRTTSPRVLLAVATFISQTTSGVTDIAQPQNRCGKSSNKLLFKSVSWVFDGRVWGKMRWL